MTALRLPATAVLALSEMPRLRVLELDVFGTEDKDVDTLAYLQQLTELRLGFSRLSEAGTGRLRAALKGVTVVTDRDLRFPSLRANRTADDMTFLRNLATASRTLTATSPSVQVTGRLASETRTRTGSPVQAWTLGCVSGRTVQIDLQSNNFDSYLIVSRSDSSELLEDDDGGDNTDSRLTFTCTQASYKAIVSSFDGNVGTFSLQAALLEP